jgi:hypothetical protein
MKTNYATALLASWKADGLEVNVGVENRIILKHR